MGVFRVRTSLRELLLVIFGAFFVSFLLLPGLAWAGEAESPSVGEGRLSARSEGAEAGSFDTFGQNAPNSNSLESGLSNGEVQSIDSSKGKQSALGKDLADGQRSATLGVDAGAVNATSELVLTAQGGNSAKGALEAKETSSAKPAGVQRNESIEPMLFAASDKRGVIDDGVYVIASGKSTTRVLDVCGASKQSGANVLLWDDSGLKHQQWRVTFDKGSGNYSIVSVNSDMALVFSEAKSGANVYQKKLPDSDSFLWSITSTSSGYVIAPASVTGVTLDVQGGAARNGDNIELWTTNNGSWQRYWFVAVDPKLAAKKTIDDGVYAIARADAQGQMIDVERSSQDDVANVLLYHSTGGANQRWYVSRDENNLYTITSVNSGKSLDVCGSGHAPGCNVIQYASHGLANQKWQIRDNGDGTHTIISKHNGLALSASGLADCSNVVAFIDNGASSERFVFTACKLLGDDVYSIASRLNFNEVVDVPNQSKDDGKQVALWSYNAGMHQKYRLEDQGNEVYTIQVAHSGMFLEDAGGRVVQRPKAPSDAQRWKAIWCATGVALTNQATKRSISISGAAKNGALLTTAATSANASQLFVFTKRDLIEDGLYTVVSGTGNRVLDVREASKADDANILLWDSHDGDNQKFDINAVSGGYYKIANYNSGKAVSATSGAGGANVTQKTYSGSTNQLWKAEIAANGGVVFVDKQSGQALSVAGNANSNGANVQLGAKSGESGQTWSLVATKPHDSVLTRAIEMANSYGSNTDYFVAVDLANHRTVVLRYSGSSWIPDLNATVSVGAPGTPTVTGTFSIGARGYSFGSGYTCYYWTQFYGDYLFHSVLYYEGTRTIQDGRLGYSISHGCVRMDIDHAYWIYNNVPYGTRVRVY